jgi:hypothetical protein
MTKGKYPLTITLSDSHDTVTSIVNLDVVGNTTGVNRDPFISLTRFFRPVLSNNTYIHPITAGDYDQGDTLTITFENLPPGLSQVPCLPSQYPPPVTTQYKSVNTCITGKTSAVGKHTIKFTIADNNGGQAVREYILPVLNSSPVILTNYLQPYVVKTPMTINFFGYDMNQTDTLDLKVTGLPPEFSFVACADSTIPSSNAKRRGCTYRATPTAVGNYPLTITFTDGHEIVTSKVILPIVDTNTPLP